MAIDYSFRKLIPGESKVDRFCRIAQHLAATGDRALLEDGAQSAPWTCMVFCRSVIWHSCLLPEDGRKVFTFAGKTFGKYGDDEDRTILGSLMFLGNFVDGRRKGNVLSLARGVCFWQSAPQGGNDHVGIVRDWTLRGDGAVNVVTSEGGQAPIHARNFVRTWRIRTDGRWDNTGASGSPQPGNSVIQGFTYLDEWPILEAPEPVKETPIVVAEPDIARADTLPSPTSEKLISPEIPPPPSVPQFNTPIEAKSSEPAKKDIHGPLMLAAAVVGALGTVLALLDRC